MLHDGMGLVAERLELFPGSDPLQVRIIFDNALYSPYERVAGETNIVGRIRWFAREVRADQELAAWTGVRARARSISW